MILEVINRYLECELFGLRTLLGARMKMKDSRTEIDRVMRRYGLSDTQFWKFGKVFESIKRDKIKLVESGSLRLK